MIIIADPVSQYMLSYMFLYMFSVIFDRFRPQAIHIPRIAPFYSVRGAASGERAYRIQHDFPLSSVDVVAWDLGERSESANAGREI